MKILCIGDLHITDDRPVNRIDNYWDTVKKKLNFIFDVFWEQDVNVMIAPGDMTDTPSLSNYELTELISLFKERLDKNGEARLLTIFGQHDLRYRTKPNTALTVLESAIKHFHILDNEHAFGEFQASGYGETIPSPITNKFNILLIHRMIVEEKLWSKQEEYDPANVFLRQNNYDLICSGDNHTGFIATTKGGRVLINCGSMMRSTIAQINHKPFVVLFDTETKKYKQIFIPIEPPEKVFRMEKVEIEKERNENLESFIVGLSEQKEIGLLFEDNLKLFAKENNIDPDIMEIIYASMDKERR